MKNNLTLKQLEVKSFVTNTEKLESKTVKGGTSLNITIITIPCASGEPDPSGQYGPQCQSQYPNCNDGGGGLTTFIDYNW